MGFRTYGGEGVAGVGDKQTRLSHSTVPNSDALYEPGRAHFRFPALTFLKKKERKTQAPDLHLRTRSSSSSPPSSASITHLCDRNPETKP